MRASEQGEDSASKEGGKTERARETERQRGKDTQRKGGREGGRARKGAGEKLGAHDSYLIFGGEPCEPAGLQLSVRCDGCVHDNDWHVHGALSDDVVVTVVTGRCVWRGTRA